MPSGFKLLHNQWINAHLGVTTKQLCKNVTKTVLEVLLAQALRIFYELPKLFWHSELHIFEISKPGSLHLSTFLLIGTLLPLQQPLVRQMSILVFSRSLFRIWHSSEYQGQWCKIAEFGLPVNK